MAHHRDVAHPVQSHIQGSRRGNWVNSYHNSIEEQSNSLPVPGEINPVSRFGLKGSLECLLSTNI